MRHLFVALFVLIAPFAHAGELRTAVLAGGCFWCVESDFDKIDGVVETVSGYAGGTTENPSYSDVTTETTGHREAVRITYDPSILPYERLVHLFLRSIDPLDPGGQFCDRGFSYSTAIFTDSAVETATAEAAVASAADALGQPLATEVRQGAAFYPAEGYHQDYYKKNPLRYHVYRKGCGRDARVAAVWGAEAIHASGS